MQKSGGGVGLNLNPGRTTYDLDPFRVVPQGLEGWSRTV